MQRHTTTLRALGALALAISFTRATASAQCGWTDRFGPPSGGDGANARIYDLTVFDDGSPGPGQLIAGGDFTAAGAAATPMRVASYNGAAWSALGVGGATNASVFALTSYTGTPFGIVTLGSEIYAGGAFTTMDGVAANRVALFDGASWWPTLDIGTGIDGTDGSVYALLAHDFDGAGGTFPPLLFAGGQFANAGGKPASNVAVWTGLTWGPLGGLGTCIGGGTDDRVDALCVFDDGSGPALYIGGFFSSVECGTPASLVAKLDPTTWTLSAVGALTGTNVYDLVVFDDGGGPALYAGGNLPGMGNVVKWNGSTWTTVGPGLNNAVRDLLVYRCTGAPQLIASGHFSASSSGSPCPLVGKWTGSDWQRIDVGAIGLSSGTPPIALCAVDYDDANNEEDLYVGGIFGAAQNQPSSFIAASCACRTAPFPLIDGEIAVTMEAVVGSEYVLNLVDVRTPFPAANTNWDAPMFHNEIAPSATTEIWNRDNLGQVFGVCYDRATPPNIYVAATAIYENDVFGPAGPGGVYKIDGATGDISTFLSTWAYSTLDCQVENGTTVCPSSTMLPNTGSGLGDICYDRFHDQFFVSDFENGRIYRIKNGHVVQMLDPFTVDAGAPGIAPLGERVWAVQVFNPRQLYFSVWSEDLSQNGGASSDNSIWVAGLNGDGSFTGGSLLVRTLPAEGGTSFAMPCSDIAFSPDNTRMLIAERGMENETRTVAHRSSVLEFIGGSLSNPTGWTRTGANSFWIGAWSPGVDAAGGADYGCDLAVFATGDALKYILGEYIYGLQRVPPGGNTQWSSTVTSQIHDMNRDTSQSNKNQIGDCEVWRPVCVSNTWTYCTPKLNSVGCLPSIGSFGDPQASAASGFTVTCSQVLGNKAGLLFYGLNGPKAAPFQGGTLCIAAPLRRTPVMNSGGSNFGCDGAFAIDMNAFAANGGDPALLVPGTIVNCQFWSRDPGSPSTTSLSDGLEYFIDQ